MNAYRFSGTSDLPSISFDNKSGKLMMSGSSLPENIFEFYGPVFKWLEKYKKVAPGQTFVEFRFDYLNTASTNVVARIISSLMGLRLKGKDLSIQWYYSTGDFDIKELGQDILDGITCAHEVIEAKHLVSLSGQ